MSAARPTRSRPGTRSAAKGVTLVARPRRPADTIELDVLARDAGLHPELVRRLVALGALILYMHVRLGDGLRFLHAEAGWGRELSPPWTSIGRAVTTMANPASPFDGRLLAAFDVTAPLLLIAAVLGILVAGTVALWAHYGTAVFYEMIVAGIAACL